VAYLLAGQQSELGRLRLQSEVWEPAGRALLSRFGPGVGRRALDVGCGALGWLRILAEAGWATVGSDVSTDLLDAARTLDLPVELVEDDLFASRLAAGSFDLVHARFQLAPLGRWDEQLRAYRRLVRPGGLLVLEDPDSASWRCNPRAPAVERLIETIRERFVATGSDFDVGRRYVELLPDAELDAHVVALPPGHPYLRLPLQFAASRGIDDTGDAAAELDEPGRWGTTFTLIQACATIPEAAA
jgi:SAM-dependent methyltransferase